MIVNEFAVDGGSLAAPNFAFRKTSGAFDVANNGVAPDIEPRARAC